MTNEELQDLCDEWKARLKLAWDVSARFVNRHEIKGWISDCETSPNLERAEVRIGFEQEQEEKDQDSELNLVHEMLHVRFWSSNYGDTGTVEARVYEAAIEATARALVKLKRESKA